MKDVTEIAVYKQKNQWFWVWYGSYDKDARRETCPDPEHGPFPSIGAAFGDLLGAGGEIPNMRVLDEAYELSIYKDDGVWNWTINYDGMDPSEPVYVVGEWNDCATDAMVNLQLGFV